jgi:hypothetical protein
MNADEKRAYDHAYYVAHRDEIIARSSQWQKDNPRLRYAATRRWEAKNPDKVAAKQARWVAKNLPKCALKTRKRRELVRAVEATDSVSSTVLAQLISSCARMKCGICGKNMPKADRTIDHVIPLAKGGTGHIGNLQVVHLSCNCRKHCKTPDQLTGQHEMNFAGNGAQPNIRERASVASSDSTTEPLK